MVKRTYKPGLCQSCGDLARVGQYCQECFNELRFGTIVQTGAKLYSSGSGCPLEPNEGDDSSPWQDNAIRDMEHDE